VIFFRKGQGGHTLLELLMVLIVIAGISVAGLRFYRVYLQQSQVALVKNDVSVMQDALNQYFHLDGCAKGGDFRGNLTLSIEDLEKTVGVKLPDGRSPFVIDYGVKIVDTGIKTESNKPVYVLEVNATLNGKYSAQRLQWYQLQFGAGKLTGDQLTWITLPGNSVAKGQRQLWVLNGMRRLFRQQENKKTEQKKESLSASYCAY